MRVIDLSDEHTDERRKLSAWKRNVDVSEMKHMVVTQDNVILGGHKHLFEEEFMLVAGSVKIITWSEERGREEIVLQAPQFAIFEPNEEHAIECSKGAIIIVFLKYKFTEETIIPAKNI